MKIKKSQLKRIIREEVSRVLKEIADIDSGPLRDISDIMITTPDGKETKVIFTGIVELDDASGEFHYKVDGKEYEWEYFSGYYKQAAAEHIMGTLDLDHRAESNWSIQDKLHSWLDSLEIRKNYGNVSRH